MKAALALIGISAALVAAVPAALAGTHHRLPLITDTLGGNGHRSVTSGNTNTGSGSAALQGYTTAGPPHTERVAVQATGFTTDTLAPGGGPVRPVVTITSSPSFSVTDAAVGAAGAAGAGLVLLGAALLTIRRRHRIALS